jgi:hypothetical protein
MYYPVLGTVILLYMFTKRYWMKFCSKVKSFINSTAHSHRLPTVLSQIVKTASSEPLTSYSMHSNPDFESILRVLYTLNKT